MHAPSVERDGLAGCCWQDEPCPGKPRAQHVNERLPTSGSVSQSMQHNHERVWFIGSHLQHGFAEPQIISLCNSTPKQSD